MSMPGDDCGEAAEIDSLSSKTTSEPLAIRLHPQGIAKRAVEAIGEAIEVLWTASRSLDPGGLHPILAGR